MFLIIFHDMHNYFVIYHVLLLLPITQLGLGFIDENKL